MSRRVAAGVAARVHRRPRRRTRRLVYEYRVGRYSVLIVRGDDGVLRAFQNVCRHRGSALCEGSGAGLDRDPLPVPPLDVGPRRPAARGAVAPRVRRAATTTSRCIAVQVDTWGPMVFVNLDLDAEPLAEFLEPGARRHRVGATSTSSAARRVISVPADCNWKTLIDGLQRDVPRAGHPPRDAGACADDVNGPQVIWQRHGRLVQSYGLPSPRQGRARQRRRACWESFVEVMGGRIGVDDAHVGPMPAVPEGDTLRGMLARDGARRATRPRASTCRRLRPPTCSTCSSTTCSRTSPCSCSPTCCQVVRVPARHDARRRVHGRVRVRAACGRPNAPRRTSRSTSCSPPDAELAARPRAQPGRRQLRAQPSAACTSPGFTHLTVSPTEECRIVNLHRNLEEYLGIGPEDG